MQTNRFFDNRWPLDLCNSASCLLCLSQHDAETNERLRDLMRPGQPFSCEKAKLDTHFPCGRTLSSDWRTTHHDWNRLLISIHRLPSRGCTFTIHPTGNRVGKGKRKWWMNETFFSKLFMEQAECLVREHSAVDVKDPTTTFKKQQQQKEQSELADPHQDLLIVVYFVYWCVT